LPRAEKADRQTEAEEGPSQDPKRRKEAPKEVAQQEGGRARQAAAAAEMNTDAARWQDLRFAVDKSLRYHLRRRAHFETLHRLVMFGVVISGSGVLIEILHLEKIFGAAAVVLGAVDLVCSHSRRARDHQALHHAFTNLAKELVGTPPADDAALQRLEQFRLEIETVEPPVYWAVEADCYNEAAMAAGCTGRPPIRLSFLQRTFKHWCRFEAAAFDKR
jgi:hypothetical protein